MNGVTPKYYLDGDKVVIENNGTDSIYYSYDTDDKLVSMTLNGSEYFYIRNDQGDITGLIDTAGTQVVSYTYDSWGKPVSIDGSLKDTVGLQNPYRYRGYRYDTETGLYYLQSRYYNPDMGRYINADDVEFLGASGASLGYNLFAYCENNPLNNSDPSGKIGILASIAIGAVFGLVVQYIIDVLINLIVGEKNIYSRRSSYADYASAALGGALAATGIGPWKSVIYNSILSGGTYIANCLSSRVQINLIMFGLSLLTGAIVGLISGGGANLKRNTSIIGLYKYRLLSAVSSKKISFYLGKIATCTSTIIISSIRSVFAGIASTLSGPVRNKIYGWIGC